MFGGFSTKRSKKKERIYPNLEADIKQLVDQESQIDPQFHTQRCYVRLTESYVYEKLLTKYNYKREDFSSRTINNLLNRLGYTLKKVLKTKPQKKIPETESIFENVRDKHLAAIKNPRILHISVDVKAKVKVGNLSRKGYARTQSAPIAHDHDHKHTAVLVPLGIHVINNGQSDIIFGNSKETSDFIVDGLQLWWTQNPQFHQNYDGLMIDLDNGQSVAGNTKLFLKRIVGFAQNIQMPIQLVYYPPYHSKYNRVERLWAALENYWSGLILDTVEKTLEIAKKMTWKQVNPVIHFIDKVYQTGIKVTNKEIKELNKFIIRNPQLPKWDILIQHTESG